MKLPLLRDALALQLKHQRLCKRRIALARQQFCPLELGLNLLFLIGTQARHRTQCFRSRRIQTHEHLGAGHEKVGVKHGGIRLLALEHHAVLLNGFGCLLHGALGLGFAWRAGLHL